MEVSALIVKRLKCTEMHVNERVLLCNFAAFDILIDGFKYCFIALYRPPSSSPESLNDANAICSIITRLSSKNKPVCVIGDINCKNIDWTYTKRPSDILDEIIFNTFVTMVFISVLIVPQEEITYLILFV